MVVLEPWMRTVYIVAGSQFLVRIGLTLIKPYLAFYIPELGVSSPEAIAFWAGFIGSANFLSQTVAAPFWGSAADKYGKKAMILRSTLAIAIMNILMAQAGSVYSLFALRLTQGFFTGFNASALAFLATIVPRERLGFAIGTLQSGQLAGTLLGPALGGIIVEAGSYRLGFIAAGLLAAVVFVLIAFFVREPKTSPQTKKEKILWLSGWKIIGSERSFLLMLLFVMVVQFSTQGMETLLALFIKEIYQGDSINLTVAAMFTCTGLCGMIMAPFLGRLGDRHGHFKILIFSLLGMSLFTGLQYFVNGIVQLFILRSLAGLFIGGLLPNIHAIIGNLTPPEKKGAVFGIVSSATSLGNFIGPSSGGIIAAQWGVRSILLVTSVLLLLSAISCRVHQNLRKSA